MVYPFQIKTIEEYQEVYQESVKNPGKFWNEVAEHFVWKSKWQTTLEWNFKAPNVKWFAGATLNITENCIDRHLPTKSNDVAIVWEANDPSEEEKKITYAELHKEVCAMATVLKNNGVAKGDRVCIYMGMIPELAYAVLACARIGAIHSVIFGGFSAQSIADRIQDASASFVITCDGAFRGEKKIPLKAIVDDAVDQCTTIKNVFVQTRTKDPVAMVKGRDIYLDEAVRKVKEAENIDYRPTYVEAEDPLFILYTSGSTGKPKGVVHSSAGYMVYTTYSFVNVFQYQPGDVYFCTADVGWITGHSYIIYGPLCAGATTLMFEGIPTFPDAGRFWDIVDKHQVNILYTAPTAIRSLMQFGDGPFANKSLSSLKVLGTVGEPINEEAWNWYHEKVGEKRCSIVDTWWQTETGGILISNLAGITKEKPTYATYPLPGIQPVLVSQDGLEKTETKSKGNLCIKFPWPSIIRTTYGDHERCRKTYFDTYKNLYFTGDGAYRDEEGNYRITGRVDDVINVSGHRIGTAEVEDAINKHTGVIESAVVGYPHDIKGQGIYAYVIFEDLEGFDEELTRKDICATVSNIIGPIAKPEKLQFVAGLPKTRSGKIMRRILRKVAQGEVKELGDTSTLLDPGIVVDIAKNRLK